MKVLKSFSNMALNLKTVKKVKENVDTKVKAARGVKNNLSEKRNVLKTVTLKSIFLNIIEMVLMAFKYSLNDVTLMPGKQLLEPVVICGCLFFISLFAYALDLPELLDWRGALVGTIVMGLIAFIGIKKGE